MTVRRMCYGCSKFFNAKDSKELYCPKCMEELNTISKQLREQLMAPEQFTLELGSNEND